MIPHLSYALSSMYGIMAYACESLMREERQTLNLVHPETREPMIVIGPTTQADLAHTLKVLDVQVVNDPGWR